MSIISKLKVKGRVTPKIKKIWGIRKVQNVFWFTIIFASIMAIFASQYFPQDFDLKAGEISPSTIKAPQTITFEDAKKTAERKILAAKQVQDIYVLDKKVVTKLEKEIDNIFVEFSRIIRIDGSERLRKEFKLSSDTAQTLATIEPQALNGLQNQILELMHKYWNEGVKEGEVIDTKARIISEIELLNIRSAYVEFIKRVFNIIDLQPNYFLDTEATAKAKQEASKNEGSVLVTIRKGQKIVGEGEIVTEEQVEILKAIGYMRTGSPYTGLLGVALFVLLNLFLTQLFVKHYRKELLLKRNNMLLLGLLVVFTLLLAKVTHTFNISPRPEVAELMGYLIPAATGSMLVAILLDTKLAIYISIVLSILVGLLTGNQLAFAANAFIGGIVGVFSVSKFSQRLDWVKAGLFIALANVVCIFSFGMMNNQPWTLTGIGMFIGIMNGFFSVIMAYGSLPFLESGFKVTTSVRLLELSNPNQPLLKRLLIEAPGTYNHSILVGNLAEAAADAVGADALLVRVGAYYHDIGKLKRPYFFIENQLGGDNPHEKLAPSLSMLIILSHVKDGIELAQEHNIPSVITELIEQHHGSSIVTYFYHKALEMGNDDNSIKESDFRYPGPKPQSKEAAIIMLADNVEAAVRAITKTSSEKIEEIVRKIIKERLQDGQLDESDLTFKDLNAIANSFIHILNGIFHYRIEYPENVLEAMKKGGDLGGADTDKQSAE